MDIQMNKMTKIEMANLVFNLDTKTRIKNHLCSFYGATDVIFKDLSYGICIEISGSDSFRFIKNAISKITDSKEDCYMVLSESEKDKKAIYVYLPDKDKTLNKKIKNMMVLS